MERCLELAQVARDQGNTPVGSLILKENQIIAEASEELPTSFDIAGHAEIIALRHACYALNSHDLSGCTLYTTAEPCLMCSYAIRETHILQVVIGAPTPNIGGVSSIYPILREATITSWSPPPIIIEGILLDKCLALHQEM